MRPFTYTKAATVAEAVRVVAAGDRQTRFLAGGTTLYDLMKLNVETPTSIVDINSLSELSGFDTSGSNELTFGALARMSDVAADPRLMREYPALSEFAVAGSVATATQHGKFWRQPTTAHTLCLFPRRRAVCLQQA